MEKSSPQSDRPPGCTITRPFEGRLTQSGHVDEQAHHVCQPTEQRNGRPRPPFCLIPFEIISRIFQELVDVEAYGPLDAMRGPFDSYNDADNLRQALVLSSVSRRFRQVAMNTPHLWNRLGFSFARRKSIKNSVPLLQHCASRTSHLDISLRFNHCLDVLERGDASLITQVLDISDKIKSLELRFPPLWMLSPSLLSTLSALDTFVIECDSVVDLLKLDGLPLSRVSLTFPSLKSVTLPPSVKALDLVLIPEGLKIPILHQCTNLLKCFGGSHSISTFPTFHDTLTLPHLKNLSWPVTDGLQTIPSVQNLRMPSLECLELVSRSSDLVRPPSLILLCQQVSATLTSLAFYGLSMWEYDELQELFQVPFPHLERLSLRTKHIDSLIKAMKALTFQCEAGNSASEEVEYLPNLRYLALRAFTWTPESLLELFPRLLLDLVIQKKLGNLSYFHLDVKIGYQDNDDWVWTSELRDELRLIVHSRDLKVTRDGRRIKWL